MCDFSNTIIIMTLSDGVSCLRCIIKPLKVRKSHPKSLKVTKSHQLLTKVARNCQKCQKMPKIVKKCQKCTCSMQCTCESALCYLWASLTLVGMPCGHVLHLWACFELSDTPSTLCQVNFLSSDKYFVNLKSNLVLSTLCSFRNCLVTPIPDKI